MTPSELPSDPPIRCERLVKIYPASSGETHALRGVEATFSAGTVTAVTGPSGSGKSSLLGILALQERQSGGELWLLGRDVATVRPAALQQLRRRAVAWVAQRPTHSLYRHLSARDMVRQVAELRQADTAGPAAMAALDRVGLAGRAHARTAQLSGGEQQRLAVAAAVVGRPAILIADEPTAELDDASADLVLAELRRCAGDGSCILLASHDARVVAAADRELHLRHGVLSSDQVGDGPAGAAIDSTGRLQLPAAALAMFPTGRAVVEVLDAEVRLRPLTPGAPTPRPRPPAAGAGPDGADRQVGR